MDNKIEKLGLTAITIISIILAALGTYLAGV